VVGFKLWHSGEQPSGLLRDASVPQLAAFGDGTIQVQKLIQDNRTLTRVERLDGELQLLELHRCLARSAKARFRSAHELMQVARQMIKTAK